nr:sodium channel modifier 1-like [Ipomoea batatas]
MSVFGGDSWAREAQHRKRRVDDLVIGSIGAAASSSAYKKLSSGKFACLICPRNPVLDTALVLSAHLKGSRHRAAESRLKEKELARQDEISKRIALSEHVTATSSNVNSSSNKFRPTSKPLIDNTRKAVSEMLKAENFQRDAMCQAFELQGGRSEVVSLSISESGPCVPTGVAPEHKGAAYVAYDRERHERELKFTAAGWKRDCHGRWFKDENVEFDSDEEDPNVCLA